MGHDYQSMGRAELIDRILTLESVIAHLREDLRHNKADVKKIEKYSLQAERWRMEAARERRQADIWHDQLVRKCYGGKSVLARDFDDSP